MSFGVRECVGVSVSHRNGTERKNQPCVIEDDTTEGREKEAIARSLCEKRKRGGQNQYKYMFISRNKKALRFNKKEIVNGR